MNHPKRLPLVVLAMVLGVLMAGCSAGVVSTKEGNDSSTKPSGLTQPTPGNQAESQPSEIALQFVKAMLNHDLEAMKALMVPEKEAVAESREMDLRTGHGANPPVIDQPTVDPTTVQREHASAQYDILVSLMYGNDVYPYRIRVHLKKADSWRVDEAKVELIRQKK